MKRELVMDIECYPDYFLVKFKAVDNGRAYDFEMFEGQPLDRATIRAVLRQYLLITFNGMDYDMPMLFYALSNDAITNADLKRASDRIINSGMRGWQFEQAYEIRIPTWLDHIDLREPVPGVQIGLKLYGGRLHSKRLQELPYDPDQPLVTAEKRTHVRDYCGNDLDTTIDLYRKARDPKDDIIGTRIAMSQEFSVDLRSKSDAQIAEAVIRHEVEKLRGGQRVYRAEVAPGTVYRYLPPAWLKFDHPALREKFAEICAADFIVKADGGIADPKCLANAKVGIGRSTYRMGIGGLHSSEKTQAVVATPDLLIRDRDVTSYYPSLILQCALFPPNMGEHFQRVYKSIVERRVHAKRTGNKSLAQTLKIVANGTFGKLGSRWSVLYAPNLLIQVTVTGQLALLMMIERMEAAGIPVVSANTDGIVMACPRALEPRMLAIVSQWERETGFETEETKYRGLFSRDVNNYVALKEGGGVKTKGVFTEPGVMKNPANVIVNDAVCAYLDQGVPFAETILGCRDVRKFLTVKRVTGGATYRDEYLGKVVRWIRSSQSRDPILYGPGPKHGHKVGGSDNARPLMELPDTFPTDIDYDYYLGETHDLLREIGAMRG